MLAFELHKLGWFAFEELCRTICREVWNQPIEVYSRGPDGGRDGSFYGPWTEGIADSPAVLQCKHFSAAGHRLTMSDIESERDKALIHAAAGRCDVYLLMTNARISGGVAAGIEASFQASGIRRVMVLGYEAICELLTSHASLRALVPRLYGLGDLTEILDDRSYAQAQAILADMHDELARLVPVEAHRAAHRALREHQFALLVGRPGSGKSSIAASLTIGAMDLYDARPIKLSKISDLRDRWNPREPTQFFWLDDAFGATQFEQADAGAWNRETRQIAAALRGGARLIVTSRDYVYAAARSELKLSAFPLLDEASVVIEVEAFTREEREQILYNHLKLGRQQPQVVRMMRTDHLEAVAADLSFLPELARRLGDPLFTRNVDFRDKESLLEFFRSPTPFLFEVLQNLDGPSRAALGLVHLRGGRLPSPYVDVGGDAEFLHRVGVRINDALRALPALDGSLLRLVSAGDERWWQFQHPTFTDAYQLWLSGQPELLAEYVSSARLDDLRRTITCGDVGLKGALIVPRPLYGAVVARLMEAAVGPNWRWKGDLIPFLARRCSDEFVRIFAESAPEIVDDVFDMGLTLSVYDNERILAEILLRLGVATEAHRGHLVEKLIGYAVDGVDGSFLSDEKWLAFFPWPSRRNLIVEYWNI